MTKTESLLKENNMAKKIRIGSRESRLAVIQAELVRNAIQRNCPELEVEIITMKTTGDMILDRSLDQIGGKGLFVKELDQALLRGQIDLSVHSLKDMPVEIPRDLPLLAYTKREDPRDILIYKPGMQTLPDHGVIGSSSKRRTLQLKKLCPGCTFRGIRGNVQTRMRKLAEENYDGTVLAMAGLNRLGMTQTVGRVLEISEVLPAAGQGILAVQGRFGEDYSYLEGVKDADSTNAALAERSFVRTLDGGCSSPIAAYAKIAGNELQLTGLYYEETYDEYLMDTIIGKADQGEQLGETLAKQLQKQMQSGNR